MKKIKEQYEKNLKDIEEKYKYMHEDSQQNREILKKK